MAATRRSRVVEMDDDDDLVEDDGSPLAEKMVIQRTGKRPLVFEGELIEEMYGANGRANRWHDISIYKTVGFNFIVVIKYTSTWDNEVQFQSAMIVESVDEIASCLENHDCTEYVQGIPPISPEHIKKQEALLQDIKLRYKDLVSFILSKLSGAEEIVE